MNDENNKNKFIDNHNFKLPFDDMILQYAKDIFTISDENRLQSIEIFYKKELEPKKLNRWYGYIIKYKYQTLQRKTKKDDKQLIDKTKRVTLFTDGSYISTDLLDPITAKGIDKFIPPLNHINNPNNYYDEKYLIATSKNYNKETIKEENKIVLFSDPLCPHCIKNAPDTINSIKQSKNNIALYFYLFPLKMIYPASITLSKIMTYVKQNNLIKEIELKIYQKDLSKHLNHRQKDEAKILKVFNEVFKEELKKDITLKEINEDKIKKEVLKQVQLGIDAFVDSVPSLFVGGVLSKSSDTIRSITQKRCRSGN